MRGNRIQQDKRGGKGLAVLAFFIGILFGIMLLIGAVGGGIYYILTTDLDSVFGFFQVDNGPDEDGNNKIINTDPESGGVSNILELITKIVDMAGNFQSLTLGEIDALVPATHGLVDQLLDSLSKYVEVDYDTLSATQFSELGNYIMDVVMDIRPYALLELANLDGDGAVNQLLDLFLCGAEAKYVTVSRSNPLVPVYYDTYTISNGSVYEREGDDEHLLPGLSAYVEEKVKKESEGEEVYTYRLYHYEIVDDNGDIISYVAEKDGNSYTATDIEYVNTSGESLYSEDYAKCSGNYYCESGSDERIYVDPITIGSFVNGKGMGALEEESLATLFGALVSDDADNERLINALLGSITIGDLMNGTIDINGALQNVMIGDLLPESNTEPIFKALGGLSIGDIMDGSIMNKLTIGALLGDISADDSLMTYLAYGVTDVEPYEDGIYTATYKHTIENADGSKTEREENVTIEVDGEDNIITAVYYWEGDEQISIGHSVNDLMNFNELLGGFMDSITIGELLESFVDGEIDPSIMAAIGDKTIGELATGGFNTIQITAFLDDVEIGDKLMVYIAYGVTEVTEQTDGTWHADYTVKIDNGDGTTTEKLVIAIFEVEEETGIITAAYYVDEGGKHVSIGTTIGDLMNFSGLLDGIMDTITIGDLLGDNMSPELKAAIGGMTINQLASGGFDEIQLSAFMKVTPDNAMMAYLAYGIKDIHMVAGATSGTAEYKDGAAVTFELDDDGYISSVYYTNSGEKVLGTTIGDLLSSEDGGILEGLMNDLKIKDLLPNMEDSLREAIGDMSINDLASGGFNDIEITAFMKVSADDAMMAYIAYEITNVHVEENALSGTADYKPDADSDVITVIVKVDENRIITSVYYMVDGKEQYLGTTIGGLLNSEDGGIFEGIMKNLTIGDLLPNMDPDLKEAIGWMTIDKLASDGFDEISITAFMNVTPDNAMMAFLAYGIKNIRIEEGAQRGTAEYKDGAAVTFELDEDGYISSVYYTDSDEKVPGTTIGELLSSEDGGIFEEIMGNLTIEELLGEDMDPTLKEAIGGKTIKQLSEEGLDDIQITVFLPVTTDDKLLAYLGYGLTNIQQSTETTYTATHHVIVEDGEPATIEVKVTVDGEKTITSVVNKDTDEPINGTPISKINARINGLMNDLTIGELVPNLEDSDNKIIARLAGCTLNNVSDEISNIAVADVMDIPADSAIMAYLAFGITEVNPTANTAMFNGEAVDLVIENGNIIAVKKDGKEIEEAKTKIDAISGKIDGIMNDLTIGELIEITEDDNKLLQKLADCTISGVNDAISTFTLSDVMDIDVNNKLMAYLAYSLTDIDPKEGEPNTYTATYHGVNGEEIDVTITTDTAGNIISVVDEYGDEIGGTTITGVSAQIDGLMSNLKIGDLAPDLKNSDNKIIALLVDCTLSDISEEISNITLADVMDIPADDNAIMAYLAFGITEVNVAEKTAKFNGSTVHLKIENGNIIGVYHDAALSNPVDAAKTKIDEVPGRITGLMNDLTIGELAPDLRDSDNKIIALIIDRHLSDVGDALIGLTIPDVIDIRADEALMAYLGYGITEVNVSAKTAKYEGETVYLDIDDNIIKGVYRNVDLSDPIPATSINGIGDRISGMASDLKIKDLIDVPADNKILSKLADSTIDQVGDAIQTLELSDVMEVKYTDKLMAYLAYGITDIKEVEGKTNEYSATYHGENGEEAATVKTDATGNIISVEYAAGGTIEGTKINGVSARISGLMNDLTIGDLIEVTPGDKLMEKLATQKLGNMQGAIEGLELSDVMDINAESTLMAYLAYGITGIVLNKAEGTGTAKRDGRTVNLTLRLSDTDSVYYIEEATYADDDTPVEGTQINQVSSRIGGLMSDLTVGELIGINDDTSTILAAIKNSTISNLSADINNLTINSLYVTSIYGENAELKQVVENNAEEGQIDFSPVYLYYESFDGGATLKLVNQDDPDNKGKLAEYSEYTGEGVLYTYGEVSGFWKLLIMGVDEATGEKTEIAYTMNDMASMANNLSDNLITCSLFDLNAAGVIDDSVADSLTTTIPAAVSSSYGNRQLGSLTISEAIDAIAEMMAYISRFGSIFG